MPSRRHVLAGVAGLTTATLAGCQSIQQSVGPRYDDSLEPYPPAGYYSAETDYVVAAPDSDEFDTDHVYATDGGVLFSLDVEITDSPETVRQWVREGRETHTDTRSLDVGDEAMIGLYEGDTTVVRACHHNAAVELRALWWGGLVVEPAPEVGREMAAATIDYWKQQ